MGLGRVLDYATLGSKSKSVSEPARRPPSMLRSNDLCLALGSRNLW